ncbi:XRE family transcriptional regulator [Tahibacter aquaticus]|uniref:XRE family transcriptional regulator n=1 Tax=Tahibacter aquaticus TaxID=520092 RepID=A0A4R6Z2E2_9GAMM|nr:cupin domain-containing protein [Tahibacter aquaticus]TDR45751.1 XRE family transcriptional regulator [Tahibacter aquaticus]
MSTDRIGERLRRYRRAARKTLLDVASEAGLSAGFLSQAERNLSGVSLSSLANIAKALNVPLRLLLDQPEQRSADSHAGRRQRYSTVDQGQSYERLSSSFPGSQINAVKMCLPVGYASETVSHDGDEFVYVLSGRVRYRVGGEEYLLEAGDSLHFDGRQNHDLANVGDIAVEVVSVGTLALFDDAPPAS